ncbi:hypothetical protein [Allorhodopirellula heiligendammensis]|uniref:Uncharacterized protein n=1 Tax=Allorhodopirellula heiligendammensis TaxID=2714739 RepID=A0A5C6C0S5_9BACT|nr:hypothetical protein [Allorhodopirellula heiligendammensis]TWU18150.1 hypothetical protein Poly21_03050 [Allorhodopirellula heiligendammensis]
MLASPAPLQSEREVRRDVSLPSPQVGWSACLAILTTISVLSIVAAMVLRFPSWPFQWGFPGRFVTWTYCDSHLRAAADGIPNLISQQNQSAGGLA